VLFSLLAFPQLLATAQQALPNFGIHSLYVIGFQIAPLVTVCCEIGFALLLTLSAFVGLIVALPLSNRFPVSLL